MATIEDLWHRIEATGPGGATRVDEDHPSDLYAATDTLGHIGLLLLSDDEPPPAPTLDAVEVTSSLRHDGRWALGIWLNESALQPVFAQLCSDLIESSRVVPSEAAAAHVLTRLVRWRQLLEGGAGPMRMSDLRGLVGELIILERCLQVWPTGEVLTAWVGPLGGPQDFVLPGLRIEVKTTFATARSVRISSIDQLDTDEPLKLAIVTLTTVAAGTDGLAPSALLDRLETSIRGDAGELAVETFHRRLSAAGYVSDPLYERPMFRVDGIQFFNVAGTFPRLRRTDLMSGIGTVFYDITIGSLGDHLTELQS